MENCTNFVSRFRSSFHVESTVDHPGSFQTITLCIFSRRDPTKYLLNGGISEIKFQPVDKNNWERKYFPPQQLVATCHSKQVSKFGTLPILSFAHQVEQTSYDIDYRIIFEKF